MKIWSREEPLSGIVEYDVLYTNKDRIDTYYIVQGTDDYVRRIYKSNTYTEEKYLEQRTEAINELEKKIAVLNKELEEIKSK